MSNQLTIRDIVRLPAKSHKAFNNALKDGWEFSKYGEFFEKNGKHYVMVFVSKEVKKAELITKTIGCDVGIKHSVCTSEGHKGHGLSKIIKKQKARHAERRRQGHKISSKVKTNIKQLLDIEAKKVIRRSKNTKASLVVENPKVVGNLGKRNLQGWAAAYFANRCHILGKENEILIWDVNPAYTSITCSKCSIRDKRSRVNQSLFKCTGCGNTLNADVNAAINIALKGEESLEKLISKQIRSLKVLE